MRRRGVKYKWRKYEKLFMDIFTALSLPQEKAGKGGEETFLRIPQKRSRSFESNSADCLKKKLGLFSFFSWKRSFWCLTRANRRDWRVCVDVFVLCLNFSGRKMEDRGGKIKSWWVLNGDSFACWRLFNRRQDGGLSVHTLHGSRIRAHSAFTSSYLRAKEQGQVFINRN